MLSTLLCLLAVHQDFHSLAKKVEPERKPKILLVGFYHFSNPRADAIKSDLDDHLAPGRQTQIQTLVEALAKFKPTKIAVERTFGSTEETKRFQEWVAGRRSLDVGESEQVGFRLAKRFGHERLYPIDYKSDMDFDPTMQLAARAMPEKAAQIGAMFGEVKKVMDGLKDHTVLENIRMLNDPEADRLGNGFYLRLATVVQGDDHPGADLVAGWWKRNLVWLANLSTVATDPNDRVLVICGGGHASLLRSLLRDSIDYEVVPPLKYLK